jgi:hypothetical protein
MRRSGSPIHASPRCSRRSQRSSVAVWKSDSGTERQSAEPLFDAPTPATTHRAVLLAALHLWAPVAQAVHRRLPAAVPAARSTKSRRISRPRPVLRRRQAAGAVRWTRSLSCYWCRSSWRHGERRRRMGLRNGNVHRPPAPISVNWLPRGCGAVS